MITADNVKDGEWVFIPAVGVPVKRVGVRARPPHGTRERLTPYYVVFRDEEAGREYECDGSLDCARPRGNP